jgi:hypothetical protein
MTAKQATMVSSSGHRSCMTPSIVAKSVFTVLEVVLLLPMIRLHTGTGNLFFNHGLCEKQSSCHPPHFVPRGPGNEMFAGNMQ